MERLKILITGANGLLGSHAIATFQDEYQVHAMVRQLPENPLKDVNYHVFDLKSDWSTDTLPAGVHSIFHLAQSELFRDFPEHALDVYNVNVTSTVMLLDYARKTGVKKFVFASTGGIYDNSLASLNENSPINTFGLLGNYFATKLCSEILSHNYTNYFDVTLLRIFFMYGKGQKRSMLMPRLVDNVRFGRAISLAGKEGIQINPIHVGDVVCLLEKLIFSSGSFTFNVAGPETLSLKQICDIIGNRLGVSPIYEITDKEAPNFIADTELLRKLVYQPATKIEDKISELF